MSEDSHDDVDGRIFRSAVVPWSLSDRAEVYPGDDTPRMLLPGRAWLELAVLASALAILIPLAAAAGIGAALGARRATNPRWRAALAAACWCGLLGVALRTLLGMAIAP